MRCLLTLGNLHGIPPLFGKVRQQPFQPFGRQVVTARVRYHRLTAGLMNHINGLFYCTPLWRNVAGFAFGQVFLEHLSHIVSDANLHQITGEVTTRHRPTVRQLLRAFKCTVNTRFRQPDANFLCAQVATLSLLGQQLHHRRMCSFNPQTHNMNLMIFPQRGDLHPVHQLQR
ncbi:hypothetical protein D3C85_1353340 [compost metagenome]